jgi:hypothetical protein
MKAIRPPFLLALMIGALACVSCQTGQKQPGRTALPAMEPYSDESQGFALFKPKGWEVGTQQFPNGNMVSVKSPSDGTMISISFLTTTDRRNNSVNFAALTLQNVRSQIPDVKLNWSRATEDRRRTVMEAQYTNQSGELIKGRYYFLMDYPAARVIACEAPAEHFDERQPILLSILSNFSLLSPQVVRASGRSAGRASSIPSPTQRYRLPDGSASLLIPPGWNVTGAKGACICVSPDQTAGFAFSKADFWGPSSLPYFDSSTIPGALHYAYMMPIDALSIVMQQLGSRNVRAVMREANNALAQEAAMRTGRASDAEKAVLAYTSGQGIPSKAYFEAIGSRPLPSGQWGILFFGIWAPESSFDDYRPTLEEMAASYGIDERYASDYIQRGMANLRRLMGETNRKMAETADAARQSNLATFQEKMRSGDYIDYKRTSMIRGEQEWVSEIEGGALYKSDHWGLSRNGEQILEGQPYNYYNFNGSSPVHNEDLTPVDASREVFEKVFGQ